jgi:hypothetical protein
MGAMSLAKAQTPPITVPAESQIVADDANLALKKDLDQRYQTLLQEFNKWNADATAFNGKYGGKNLDADTQEAKEGLAEQARVSQALQAYQSEADQFKNDVGRLRLASPTPIGNSAVTLPVARVVEHGEFHIVTKDGRTLSGAEATAIPLDGGTHLFTGSDGHLKMLLPDETTFTVGPDSDIVLDDFVYDQNHSLTKAGAQIMKGNFRWITGKISQGHEHDLRIKIPVGTLGSRWTDFECTVDASGSGYVKLYEGQLDITENKTGDKLELNTGQMTSFAADGTFTQPAQMNP